MRLKLNPSGRIIQDRMAAAAVVEVKSAVPAATIQAEAKAVAASAEVKADRPDVDRLGAFKREVWERILKKDPHFVVEQLINVFDSLEDEWYRLDWLIAEQATTPLFAISRALRFGNIDAAEICCKRYNIDAAKLKAYPGILGAVCQYDDPDPDVLTWLVQKVKYSEAEIQAAKNYDGTL